MASALDHSRQDQLSEFATQYLPDSLTIHSDDRPLPLQGDAGFRRYYRWSSCPAVLGVDAPPESEDSLAFVRIADLLRGLGVRSPRVYAANLQQGLLVVENLGSQSYQQALSADAAPELYAGALDALCKIQGYAARPPWLPLYDAALLRQEMNLFVTWFVHKLLGYEVDAAEDQLINGVFDELIKSALNQPQVLTHRDYHCRNLLVSADDGPGIIDFQDAVWGPVTYDLVSLMRDCYVRWHPARITEQLQTYLERLGDQGVLASSQIDRAHEDFDLMGLQRHLKVLGIFSRLWLRDGKSGYLDDLPLVLRYVMEVSASRPATLPLADWIDARLIPLAAQQDWYQDWATAGDAKTIW